MFSASGFIHPLFSLRGTLCKRLLSALFCLLVCTVGFHTGVSAFAPGAGHPPGVPDLTHPDTKLIITKNFAVANGIDQNIVVAHIVDEFGTPVSNVAVSFKMMSSGGGGNPVAITDINGNASFAFTGDAVGPVTITAKVGASPIVNGSPAITFFIAGPPDVNAPTTTLSVIADNAIANNTATNKVRAHITDAAGNPIANQTIYFTIASGIANITSTNPITTDASGNADVTLISPIAGQVHITATMNGLSITNGSPAIVTFIADVPQTSNPATALSVVTNNAVANGTATNSVKAHVVDANGNPVPNATIVFTIASGTASFASAATVTTNANGDAVVTLNSTVAGSVNITATVNGTSIVNGSPATVIFVADAPSTSNPATALIILTNNSPANGTTANTVRARIRDANGNPVQGATIQFSIMSGTGTIVGTGTTTTDANGHAIVSITSTVAGNVSIVATVNGTPIVNGSPAVVTFVADVPQTSNPATALSVVTNNAVANGTATNSVKAHVVDANGNPVPNATIVFTIASGTASFASAATVTTNANGDAVVTLNSTVAGSVNITATVNGTPIVNGSPAVVTFVADVPQTSNPATALSVVTNNALANGTATNSVKAHVVDANGNPVPNATIVFTIASGTASFASAATVTTNANGDAVVTLNSTAAGSVNITATVNGTPIVNGSPATVIFVADAPQTSNPATALSVVTNNALANGTATNSVKAHVVDANGNPVPNATIVFTIASGTASFAGAATITTNANGDAVVTLNSTVAGSVNITATVNGTPILNGSPATVIFVADAPSGSNPLTALSVEVTGMIADGAALNGVKAHVVDAQGNPVPGATVEFTIASGIAVFESASTLVTDANGDAIVTLKSTVAGQVGITAKANGVTIVNGSPAIVVFTADVPSTANPATALIVVTNNAMANGVATNSVKAHIVDANGNPVPDATVEFTIASGAANIVGANPLLTDANGDAVITLNSTVVGEVTITAIVNGVSITNGSPAKVVFVVDVPAVSNPATALSVVTNNALADGVATNSVKAHVEDAHGNPVPGATIEFTIASGTAVFEGGSPNVITDANGDAIITLHSTVAGQVGITAKVNGVSIINGSPALVTFIAGGPDPGNAATALIVVTNNAQANGTSTNSVKAHIVDAHGNPVPGATIEFTIANGTASIVETNPLTTDANGDAIITLTSTIGGTVDITATVNGTAIINGSPATVTFVTDPDVTAPDTRLIVLANNALADGVETNSVKAHVVDATGTPLSMKEVFFKIESGDATVLTVQPVRTDANGDATILLASKTAGTVTITAKVSDKPILNGSPAKLRFVPIDIYVPKIFTPNNDGHNDVVKPIVVGLPTFHYFSIYNRWGNLVFTTKDPNVGWDGRFKGVLQPVETYLWIAEGLDKDKKKITRKGMISLVR